MCVQTLRTVLVFPRRSIWGVTCLGLLKKCMFPIYLHRNPQNVCLNPQNSAHFSRKIDLRGHMPRFSWKMHVFPAMSLFFLRWSISGVTCLGFLSKWMFSDLSPEKPHKCVLKPSEQCSFFQDIRFEGSHAKVSSKNECFSTYLLRNPINVSWNPQNSAHFSRKIDLRGHMPRFSWKMHVFPAMSFFIWDDRFEGSHAKVYSKNECFPIYLLRNPINVSWNPQNSAHFSETIDLRGHIPRFPLKMNVFLSISWETFVSIIYSPFNFSGVPPKSNSNICLFYSLLYIFFWLFKAKALIPKS